MIQFTEWNIIYPYDFSITSKTGRGGCVCVCVQSQIGRGNIFQDLNIIEYFQVPFSKSILYSDFLQPN